MPFLDLYPLDLDHVGAKSDVGRADTAIYRLMLRRLAVGGLPESVAVGDVTIHFTRGPIHTQVTSVRQRPGWPPVFDKHMHRAVQVGHNDLLTVCELRLPLGAEDLSVAIDVWRARAHNAVGVLSATLDERVALEPLAEDVILLRGGEPFAATDVHSLVRTFMPFDVTEQDRQALASLAGTDVGSDVAYAASLLATGARQGPTPTGFLFLWLAIDATVGTHKTQKAAVAQALADAGADLSWLTLPLGRLVGLRGRVAHGRTIEPGLLRDGFYDSEAVARILVRRVLGIEGGWPAAPAPTAFPLPLGRRIAEQAGAWNEEWHQDGLPAPVADPEPSGLPRLDAVMGAHSEWLRVLGAPTPEVEERIRFWAMAAVNATDVDVEPFEIHVGVLDHGSEWAVDPERILMAETVAAGPEDDREPRMAWQLCRLVAEMQIMRTGVESVELGAFMIDLGGAWVAYREWVLDNEMPGNLLARVALDAASTQDLGATAGVALAGDAQAREALDAWIKDGPAARSELREAISYVLDELAGLEHFGEYLRFTSAMVEAERPARGDT